MLNVVFGVDLDWCRRVSYRSRIEFLPPPGPELPSRLTLGGGYGWLSGSHGLVIDNLVQVQCQSNFSATLILRASYPRQPLS